MYFTIHSGSSAPAEQDLITWVRVQPMPYAASFMILRVGRVVSRQQYDGRVSKHASQDRRHSGQSLNKIEREIEKHSQDSPGLIQLKTNALEDKDITKALYQASQAGVR